MPRPRWKDSRGPCYWPVMIYRIALILLSGGAINCHGSAPPESTVQATPIAAQSTSQLSPKPATTPLKQKTPAERYCNSSTPHEQSFTGQHIALEVPLSRVTDLDPKDTEFHLYEGAVWHHGALYFSDFQTTPGFPSRIMRYLPGSPLQVAFSDSGSNGLSLNITGDKLVAARHKSKSIWLLDDAGNKAKVIASGYENRNFNSPNDLVFRSDGNLYFTDPDFQAGEVKDQATTNVYRVSPSGEVSVVDDSIKNPNGIALSLDESTLYVAGNMEDGYLKSYDLSDDGSSSDGKLLLNPVRVPDGLTLDCAGNIYITEHSSKRIRVIDRMGRELGEIIGMDRNVTNLAFGGPDRRTLYITTTGALFETRLATPGLPY